MKAMKRFTSALFVCLLIPAWSAMAQTGSFQLTVQEDGKTVTLNADKASSNAIIKKLAEELGIVTRLSPDNDRVTTLSLESVTPVDLVHQLSDSYALTYKPDPETNEIQIVSIYTGANPPKADPKALSQRELIALIEEKAAKIKTYKTDMSISMNMMGSPMKMDGTLMVCGENKMIMKIAIPGLAGNQITFVEGDTTFQYMDGLNMVQKFDQKRIREELGPEMGSAMDGNDQFRLDKPFKDYNPDEIEFSGTREENGRSYHVFTTSLPKGFEQAQKLNPMLQGLVGSEVWFDSETGVGARNLMLNEKGEAMMDIRMDNTEINPPADELNCDYELPEDAQVMDMTEGIINMMKAQMQKTKARNAGGETDG